MVDAVLAYAVEATWTSTREYRRLQALLRRNQWLRWVKWAAVVWASCSFVVGMWPRNELSSLETVDLRQFWVGQMFWGLSGYAAVASLMAAGTWWAATGMVVTGVVLAVTGGFVIATLLNPQFARGASTELYWIALVAAAAALVWYCLQRLSWPKLAVEDRVQQGSS